jgi:hypothetical protein
MIGYFGARMASKRERENQDRDNNGKGSKHNRRRESRTIAWATEPYNSSEPDKFQGERL